MDLFFLFKYIYNSIVTSILEHNLGLTISILDNNQNITNTTGVILLCHILDKPLSSNKIEQFKNNLHQYINNKLDVVLLNNNGQFNNYCTVNYYNKYIHL